MKPKKKKKKKKVRAREKGFGGEAEVQERQKSSKKSSEWGGGLIKLGPHIREGDTDPNRKKIDILGPPEGMLMFKKKF